MNRILYTGSSKNFLGIQYGPFAANHQGYPKALL
jgi:hypothetical protein